MQPEGVIRCSSAIVCTSKSRLGPEGRPATRMVAHLSLNCSSLAGTFHFFNNQGHLCPSLRVRVDPLLNTGVFPGGCTYQTKAPLFHHSLVTQTHRNPPSILYEWKQPVGGQGQSSKEKNLAWEEAPNPGTGTGPGIPRHLGGPCLSKHKIPCNSGTGFTLLYFVSFISEWKGLEQHLLYFTG